MINNRVTEIIQQRFGDLIDHPMNPKHHPPEQQELVQEMLDEIGWIGVVPAYRSERNGGQLTLLDGHLRKILLPDFMGHVAIHDLTDQEADIMVGLLDYSAWMAHLDPDIFSRLQQGIQTNNQTIRGALQRMADEALLDSGKSENGIQPPEDFPEYDDDIVTEYQCPKCGYEWAGQPR